MRWELLSFGNDEKMQKLDNHSFEGKPPNAQQPLLMTNQPTDQQPTAEELKYDCDRAWWH
jgi:hypothetical protein